MSVFCDDSGHRKVKAEIEVPGTPEEVWQAIATGPGISCWFVPTTVEEKVGGEIVASFGPGMDSVSKVIEWDPPRRLFAESQDLGPDAPTVGSEWIVEARDGGTCIVRVVHSLFTDSDQWDGELEAWEGGWPDFFRILSHYLTHHRGQRGVLMPVSAMTSMTSADAWKKFQGALGIDGVAAGDERRLEAVGSHRIAVEAVGEPPHHPEWILLRTLEPVPGLAHAFAYPMGEQTMVSLRFYLYGDDAPAAVERDEPKWSAWMNELYPASSE